jgi:hypothetical protein
MDSQSDLQGELIPEDVLWDPWTPENVASRLAGTSAPWYVVAGWALDLFVGRQTRPHDDIEIGVPSGSFPEIREDLGGYDFDVVDSGRRWPLSSEMLASTFQTWLRDTTTGVYHLDVFRDPHNGSEWICRRDERIRMPLSQLICYTASGIPYMSPEVALLFKAKGLREKDQVDFERVLPLLDPQQIDWFRANLELVHPGHVWANQLQSTPSVG